MPERFAGLILECAAAKKWREDHGWGTTLVFTNGCFDLMHGGHIEYLAWARAQGDALIVGLNEDESVRRLKGPARPFVPFEERARVLAALRSVDVVVGFAEQTPEALIEALHPDIHVKSAQYKVEDLPERLAVERGGGRVLLAPHIAGKSTTDLIALIRSRF